MSYLMGNTCSLRKRPCLEAPVAFTIDPSSETDFSTYNPPSDSMVSKQESQPKASLVSSPLHQRNGAKGQSHSRSDSRTRHPECL